jgi:peptide-methionine (R)-S-oxide reductase
MDRRGFLKLAAGGASVLAWPLWLLPDVAQAKDTILRINHSDAEWKKILSADQYAVLRKASTEMPFSSPLDHETRAGLYVCAGCALPLFPSRFKFDSGTGWPSFFDTLPGHVLTQADYTMIEPRTEYHCARCGGHQGHVFDDGPAPTGLRYCNNGVALKFILQGSKA